jgi:hypothetical protein
MVNATVTQMYHHYTFYLCKRPCPFPNVMEAVFILIKLFLFLQHINRQALLRAYSYARAEYILAVVSFYGFRGWSPRLVCSTLKYNLQ